MKKLVLLSLVLLSACCRSTTEVYFIPYEDAEKVINYMLEHENVVINKKAL